MITVPQHPGTLYSLRPNVWPYSPIGINFIQWMSADSLPGISLHILSFHGCHVPRIVWSSLLALYVDPAVRAKFRYFLLFVFNDEETVGFFFWTRWPWRPISLPVHYYTSASLSSIWNLKLGNSAHSSRSILLPHWLFCNGICCLLC